MGFNLALLRRRRSPGGADILLRYAVIEGGFSYLPLFVDDAYRSGGVAYKRSLELSDYAVIELGVFYSPLFVDDATNNRTIK